MMADEIMASCKLPVRKSMAEDGRTPFLHNLTGSHKGNSHPSGKHGMGGVLGSR